MKILIPVTALLVLAMVVGGCLSDPSSSRETRLWIAPEVAECVGVGPRTCLLVKESEDADWQFFYDGIEGFSHVEGVSYVLDVEITEIEDPPADGSSLHYRLIRVVESTPDGG